MEKRVVIVTGAAQGIGAAVSRAFAKSGAVVILADMEMEAADEVAADIRKRNEEAHAIRCDVRHEEQIIELVSHVQQQFGRIDVLINNVGKSKWSSPFELSVSDWDDILATNVRSVFLFSREAAKVMRKQKKGAIINIASTRAAMSEPHSEAYATSKGGIVALTHALAASFQQEGIRVNAISPGWIHTGKREELREQDHAQHFSKRVGEPDDIARACLFLADDDNSFINGENITIDGGMTRKMIYEH